MYCKITCSLLHHKYTYVRLTLNLLALCKFPKDFGIVPVNQFPSSNSVSVIPRQKKCVNWSFSVLKWIHIFFFALPRFLRLPSSFGIVPWTLLDRIFRNCSRFIVPNSLGKVPVRELNEKERYSSIVNFSIEEGIEPVISFKLRSRNANILSRKKES